MFLIPSFKLNNENKKAVSRIFLFGFKDELKKILVIINSNRLTDITISTLPTFDAFLNPIFITDIMAEFIVPRPTKFCTSLIKMMDITLNPDSVGELSV